MRKTTLLLICIIVLAVVLRFWQLGKVPVSLDWDEAALGYNAYSILLTGKDEYGKAFPVVLQSFNDYKPALYAYLIIPFIKLFGLTAFAVRFPSALMGVVAVIATYLLVKEFFSLGEKNKFSEHIALLAAFFLALSPWHIQFSRAAFEANVALSFNLIAMLCFIKGLKKHSFFPLSALFLSLSIYTYQSQKLYVILLVGLLILSFYRSVLAIPKRFILAFFVVGFLSILPMVYYIVTTPDSLSRIKGVSSLASTEPAINQGVARSVGAASKGDKLGVILDNRRYIYIKILVGNYLSHFDPNFLFVTGDEIERSHPPHMGNLYLWELLFIPIGIYTLLFGRFQRSTKIFFVGFMLIAPIPAAFTWDVPNAIRTISFLPSLQLFSALGVISAYDYLKKKTSLLRYLSYAIFAVFFIFTIAYYMSQYFVQYNYFNSQNWQYGYEAFLPDLLKIQDKYKHVTIGAETPLDQSYIFFLFYLQYPPADYQKIHGTSGEYLAKHTFGRYQFRPIDWSYEKKTKDYLYVGGRSEFPEKTIILKTFNFKDGEPAISFVDGGQEVIQ